MLFLEPIVYFKFLQKKFKNTYIAEDNLQVIIGIDSQNISSLDMSFEDFKNFYYQSKEHLIAPFAGLFGVFSYEMVHIFEDINKQKKSNYFFPDFYFSNARAYLHYDKISKIYTTYGDEYYFENLHELKDEKQQEQESFYKIITSLKDEEEHFNEIFKRAHEYLKLGDIFQIVLSEQLELETNLNSLSFYEKLKAANPSPYMYFYPTPYGDVVGSSPELITMIKNNEIIIEPIAGTRGRGQNPLEDKELKLNLISDEKELCEHKMLVDLARNDISKFAKTNSVKVSELINVVFYEHVMHIISKIVGQKRDDVSIFDIISVVFPAGTLSGTPKIRAMQIINELEIFKRNTYGGGLGFLHFNGDVQLAILIRSAFFEHLENFSRVFIQAGAGIVYDSVAKNEYQEICKKRASVLNIFKNFSKEIK